MSNFDHYANTYDKALDCGLALSGEDKTFFAKGRIVWLSLCLKQLGFIPEVVLDYGCGIGTSTPFFIHLLGARSVVGLDSSANSLAVARESNKDFPAQYKLIQEHEAGATVDLAFCNGVFHHIPVNERHRSSMWSSSH